MILQKSKAPAATPAPPPRLAATGQAPTAPPATPDGKATRAAELIPPPVFRTPGGRPAWLRKRRTWIVGGVLLVLLLAGGAALKSAATPPPAPVPTPVSAPKLTARGVVRPVNQSRVGTLTGGVVQRLSVDVGDTVAEQQEVARVQGPSGVEVLTAPVRGTISGVLAHVGDTVLAGAPVVTIADLSRLQVETTDVDEFIVGSIQRGQRVTLRIDALDSAELQGRVRTVAVQPQTTTAGDQQYPVVIDFSSATTGLVPGMSVRVTFAE